MTQIARFLQYAAAFEEAYAADDWTKIAPYFTEDAVYEPLGAFGEPIVGRGPLQAALKGMVDAFDRRFASRSVEVVEGPLERDGAVWFRWAATYTLAGAPPLRMEGEETAIFEGDRIRHLADRMAPAEVERVQAYMAAHGAKLR
jgi:ketosteroid isomerase-like protein